MSSTPLCRPRKAPRWRLLHERSPSNLPRAPPGEPRRRRRWTPYDHLVIKYLGSKRLLVPVLGEVARAVQARTAVDLFTGTTRVAQEFKSRGIEVTATDLA